MEEGDYSASTNAFVPLPPPVSVSPWFNYRGGRRTTALVFQRPVE